MFDPTPLIEYDTMVRGRILHALHTVPFLTQPRTVELQQDALESVFGCLGPGHAFSGFCPDWGIRMLERQASGGLAHLLGRGTRGQRALRIRSFLEALKVPNLPDNGQLERVQVLAENDRIDLEFRFPPDNCGRRRVVIVEFKLDSPIQPKQLHNYYQSRTDYERCCRLISLDPDITKGLKGHQHKIWKVLLWRDVWLRFEKTRPLEIDGQVAAFQSWLWERIGGLSPRPN